MNIANFIQSSKCTFPNSCIPILRSRTDPPVNYERRYVFIPCRQHARRQKPKSEQNAPKPVLSAVQTGPSLPMINVFMQSLLISSLRQRRRKMPVGFQNGRNGNATCFFSTLSAFFLSTKVWISQHDVLFEERLVFTGFVLIYLYLEALKRSYLMTQMSYK